MGGGSDGDHTEPPCGSRVSGWGYPASLGLLWGLPYIGRQVDGTEPDSSEGR